MGLAYHLERLKGADLAGLTIYLVLRETVSSRMRGRRAELCRDDFEVNSIRRLLWEAKMLSS